MLAFAASGPSSRRRKTPKHPGSQDACFSSTESNHSPSEPSASHLRTGQYKAVFGFHLRAFCQSICSNNPKYAWSLWLAERTWVQCFRDEYLLLLGPYWTLNGPAADRCQSIIFQVRLVSLASRAYWFRPSPEPSFNNQVRPVSLWLARRTWVPCFRDEYLLLLDPCWTLNGLAADRCERVPCSLSLSCLEAEPPPNSPPSSIEERALPKGSLPPLLKGTVAPFSFAHVRILTVRTVDRCQSIILITKYA